MAIAHVHTDTSGDIASTTATTTITTPTGSAATDVLIAVFGDDVAGGTQNTPSAPAGWTLIGAQVTATSGVNHIGVTAFWALGNVSNKGFTNNHTAGQQGWVCAAFSGVDNTTPIDVTGTGTTSTGASSVTANAVTIATANAWEVIAACDWLGKVGFTATSFTETHNTAANASVSFLYNTTPKSTGSTGTVVVNNSDGTTASEIMACLPFALRPAASGSPIGHAVVIGQSIMNAATF